MKIHVPRTIHIVQHVSFEQPGAIFTWAERNHHQCKVIKPWLGDRLPTSDETDLLILLGGPMSVHDEAEHPWLALEKTALRQFIADDRKPLLGICLGAQLIADGLGARVYKNSQQEVGWFDISLERAGHFSALKKSSMEVFHWHGETFELPPGAKLLAKSTLTAVQAFQKGDKILAFQFHPEMNAAALDELLIACGAWINPAEPVQQSVAEIRARTARALPASEDFLAAVLTSLVSAD